MALTCFITQLAGKYQPFLSITPSAVLVLLWYYLMYTHYLLFIHFTGRFTTEVAPATWYKYGFFNHSDIWLCLLSFIWSVC